MADKDGFKVAKDYHVGVPFANQEGFYVKGANSLDWGMKKHLSNIFNTKSGNSVMFAFLFLIICCPVVWVILHSSHRTTSVDKPCLASGYNLFCLYHKQPFWIYCRR